VNTVPGSPRGAVTPPPHSAYLSPENGAAFLFVTRSAATRRALFPPLLLTTVLAASPLPPLANNMDSSPSAARPSLWTFFFFSPVVLLSLCSVFYRPSPTFSFFLGKNGVRCIRVLATVRLPLSFGSVFQTTHLPRMLLLFFRLLPLSTVWSSVKAEGRGVFRFRNHSSPLVFVPDTQLSAQCVLPFFLPFLSSFAYFSRKKIPRGSPPTFPLCWFRPFSHLF